MSVKAFGILFGFLLFLVAVAISLANLERPYHPTPNQLTALEARVHILEGQVKELRRVVGLEGGLKEGLQFKKARPTAPEK